MNAHKKRQSAANATKVARPQLPASQRSNAMSRRDHVFLWVAPVIAVQWLLLVVIDPDAGSGLAETLSIGFFLGTMLGQATLAAAWAPLGPGPLVWRLPLSLIWLALLALGLTLNLGLHRGPPGDFVILMGLCLLGQWVLLQFPLWGLALGYGIHLRHAADALQSDQRQRQFGIRQLIIVTAIVGVTLGLGRMLVARFATQIDLVNRETPIFIFLGVAAVVLTLPLMLAMLMRRFMLRGLAVAILLIVIVTACELPLLKLFHGGPGPKTADFVSINVFTSLIMLMVLGVIRWCGYSLTTTSHL